MCYLVELKKIIIRQLDIKVVQFVTISRPTVYSEYAPYHFVGTEQEF